MATALALLPEKRRSRVGDPSRIGTTVSVMGYAICAIRLAEQTIDDYQLAPGPNFAGSGSMLRIGRSSSDLRPSHRTITLALLAVTRSTTPHRSVQSSWPGRMLLLNALA